MFTPLQVFYDRAERSIYDCSGCPEEQLGGVGVWRGAWLGPQLPPSGRLGPGATNNLSPVQEMNAKV